ncbi:ribosome maturation factor RimP [Halothermothrix orenii]|uniref:Ribosome maturation factor RimP n=1 Tax=Halothermothrix orenii (strain H 168 / OCM 544 / DSM 9562) TaxID=373903 RepID=RIMP_HALOH|nr:ribosome maturation factor RimP [Halothermothrix orenii]B8CW69.1 RecName: Full=Ribosome maturation factor RimP [Halothermothrix orenii H 168]ACL69538.1 uncharacterized protein conserved in bacteria [Halothermothrix orenii H 168]
MGKITDRVEDLAQPIVESQGLELVDVEYVKEGENRVLRVFIENPEGEVTLDHCENVSKNLDEKLDEVDPIQESYILEVSSPGIERPLKKKEDFDRFSGKLAYIKTFAPVSGNKEITGIIKGRDGDNIKVLKKDDDKELEIPFSQIAKAHLMVDFDNITG